MVGETIGHYEILAKLGEGGMGEVYRARDTTLKRPVALKVLSPEMAASREALERFQREAEALATLDHPNIAHIYSVEEAQGIRFLTMQLVDGQPLSALISRGWVPLEQFFEIAIPLADALAAAHERGVVHRDLKPANIMISDEGRVKVLDFGLAKLRPPTTDPELSESPTMAMTREGVVLGTLPYMSPEQVQGRDLDHRSDIFSLGVVLHEMATGDRPFHGRNAADLISSLLRDTASSVDALRGELPPQLGRIIRRCLERDPRRRFQTARDVCNELDDLRSEREIRRDTRSEIRAVAVLPLENLSGDPAQEYFADGMTEALITDLAKIGALKVISRTSVMQYKGVHKPLPRIAEELAVDAVIEGSVLRVGERVRITTQLVDARTDDHLWAEQYDHDVRDVLALMSEVARSVADEVRIQLTARERSLLATKRRVQPRAHEDYLKGRYLLGQLTREGVDRAIELMQSAIEQDPSYAEARAGLADCYLTLVLFGWMDYAEGLPLVRAAALEALERDDTLADAHAALANADARDRKYGTAEEGFLRALELSPNHARAHGDYSALLVWLGRLDEAIAEARLALELEPLSLKAGIDLVSALYYARRYDEAERQIREVLALHPRAPYAEWCLGIVLAQQGRYEEAIATLRGRQVPTASTNWALGYLYGVVGRREEAQAVLEFLLERSREQFLSPAMIAYVYLGLGDQDKALELLEETCDGRGGRLIYLQVDPWLDPLRDDPRFEELLRRMKFPRG